MINTSGRPVIGIMSGPVTNDWRTRTKLRNYILTHYPMIEVLDEHFESFVDDDGNVRYILTYDPETYEVMYPILEQNTI